MMKNPKTGQPLRILYVDGPGDIAGTFEQWKQGHDDATEVSRTFSGDVFELVRDEHLDAYLLATNPRLRRIEDGSMVIEHRPVPSRRQGGLKYHVGEIRHAFSLVAASMRFKADAIIVADQLHWFALYPLHLLGKKIIVMLHCAFWPAGLRGQPSAITRRVQGFNAAFWHRAVDVTLCISPEVERQLRELAGSGNPIRTPILQVRSQYNSPFFEAIPPPASSPSGPFRVLFAGRLEREKGVFDLLEIATRLNQEAPGTFLFELAGDGSAREELAREVSARGAETYFRLLGKQDQAGMSAAFTRSHAVIVPTSAGFAEGMNRVAIEGVLAGRPVVTSPVSHVSDVLGDAIVQVPVGDIDAYVAALTRLRDDPQYYAQLRAGTGSGTRAFFDRDQSYKSALTRALSICFPK